MTIALGYSPVSDSYSFTPAYNVIEVKLDGGRSRKRVDILGGSHTINPMWILRASEYTKLMGFFRDEAAQGTSPFLVDLVSDVGIVMPHVCRCVGGLPRLTRQRGDAYWVEATLEVDPTPTYTGTAIFTNAGTPLVAITNPWGSPTLFGPIEVGDDIMIVDGICEDVGDLSGTYEVTDGGGNSLEIAGAAAVNPLWTALQALGGAPPQRTGEMVTVVKIMT